ncbi:dienelactone hydrolase [Nostoc sp. TCL26-01]|uniref:alpha/beta hydrolase family protein n=1 Tax=Nostoc sp. TCL26-01 TaxID=2576904 RepID=UPI0015BC9790|nr:dienelactone hydrolase [Nostoc sp. TCL26-01]QLE58668.1 dienelactone hydrolase [Nostoc sp. TCL26-01]
MTIQAILEAIKIDDAVSPYDTLHLKIFYPAISSDDDLAKNWGILPVDLTKAPFPVVIFFNGFNCDARQYQWLAVKLAEAGLVVILFNWIAESLPGMINFTPGFNWQNRQPQVYGTVPTASALPAILTQLEKLQTASILAGTLDLQKIILGGHSEGGRLAIENAQPNFFPQVVASFAYAAHTGGAAILGYEIDTILPLPDSLPLLMIGGTCDGIIANGSPLFGFSTRDSITPIIRTFQAAITGGRCDSYLLMLDGANHFSIVDILDPTLALPFVDFSATKPQEDFRGLLAEIITLFIDAHVRNQTESHQQLEQLLHNSHPLIRFFECK